MTSAHCLARPLLAALLGLAAGPGHAASLCPPDEPVRFSCQLARSGKTVSLCEGPRHLVYRAGTPGRVELLLPDPAAPSAPYLVQEEGPGATLKGVAFARGTDTWLVTHFVGGRPATEALSLTAQRKGSPDTLMKCATRPAPVGDLPALFEQLRAAGMRVMVR